MVTFFKLFHVSAPLWDLVAIHSRPMAVPSEGSSFVPSDGRALSKEAGTQTLDADWKSLKSWLPQNGNKKEGKRCESKAFHQARSACVAVALPSREIPRIMPGKYLCTSKSVETQVVLESGKRGSEHACRSLTGEKNREITKTPGARWRRSVLVSMTYGKVRRTAYL